MKFISSDTNIWLDFNAISKIDLPFLLPCTYVMYKEALRSEVISPAELLSELQELGLMGVEISIEEFYYAQDIAHKYVKLSGYDRIALAIAKIRKFPLLTGDEALRKAAQKEHVEVFGTIGLLDKLYEGSYISPMEYKNCLESLLNHKERRLPEEELKKRIKNLETILGKDGGQIDCL